MLTFSSCQSENYVENECCSGTNSLVRDLNTGWHMKTSVGTERKVKGAFLLDVICGFRKTRGLAIRDNKAGICDV